MNTWGYLVLHALESAPDLVVVCLSPGRLCGCAEVKPFSNRLQVFLRILSFFTHIISVHM